MTDFRTQYNPTGHLNDDDELDALIDELDDDEPDYDPGEDPFMQQLQFDRAKIEAKIGRKLFSHENEGLLVNALEQYSRGQPIDAQKALDEHNQLTGTRSVAWNEMSHDERTDAMVKRARELDGLDPETGIRTDDREFDSDNRADRIDLMALRAAGWTDDDFEPVNDEPKET